MKKILSLLLASALLLSALPLFGVSAAESDTNKIKLLSALEIMVGDPDGNFRTQDPVSRAEFAKIAVAASPYADLVATGAPVSPFSDVPYTHWSAPYVLLAVNNGIVKGYTDGSFRPDGTVLYEEAVTMLLHLLGYSDADFGLAWPYGQMATAKSLSLTDGVSASVGEPLDRGDAMTLVYNLLDTPAKAGGADYIQTLGYTRIEDAVLIATAAEEVSVGAGKVLTSAGTYRIGTDYDSTQTGRRGDIILKNRDEVKTFLPQDQQCETYSVYQVLSDDVMVMKNGTLSKLGLGKSLTVYHEGRGTALSALLNTLTVGDSLTVYRDANGTPDYATVSTDDLVGPITVQNANWLTATGLKNPEIMKNGARVTATDIAPNDIIYYSTALNRVFAYRKQVTGVYEKALPNQDQPTSVVVSGTTYAIEGASALDQLASGGIAIGSSVTLLLGKSGGIADVITPQGSVVGYLTQTGTKSYETDASLGTYTGYYATVIAPDGESYTYITDRDYKNSKNRVVQVTFDGAGVAKITTARPSVTVSGAVDADNNKIGNKSVAPDVKILDVSTTDVDETALWTSVYLKRLDGMTLSASSVLYAQTNDQGQISLLILKDATGDMFDYVLITKAEETVSDTRVSGQYTYLKEGTSHTAMTNGTTFGIKTRTGAKMVSSPAGVQKLSALTRISEGITQITPTTLIANGTEYRVSDRVQVYTRDANYGYNLIPITDLTLEGNRISAYHDGLPKQGGQVRIIIVE